MSVRRVRLNLQSLETREVPAVRVDPFTLWYKDFDGDSVIVKLSKPLLTDDALANSVFTFDIGNVDGTTALRQQLRSIGLNIVGAAAKGTNVTVSSTYFPANGDGFADIGTIDATGIDIGNITVDGDLGDIQAGDTNYSSPAVSLLKVNSMGRFGTSTGGTLASALTGKVGSIAIKTSAIGVSIRVNGDANSNLGSLTIGGSLIGGSADQTGYIRAAGKIGPIVVGGNLIGTGFLETGTISSAGAMGDVTIKGSLLGGSGQQSGAVFSGAGMGIVKITGDLRGDGSLSGSVRAETGAVSVSVGGSLLGGAADESGALRFLGNVGPVTVGHDLIGGGIQSGRISANKLGNIVVGGSMVGSDANDSGQINAPGGIGTVTVKGDVRGGRGQGSAAINSGAGLGKVTILGSLVGGGGVSSAQVGAINDIGGVSITGSIRGAAGDNSARILAGGRLLNLTVGGSIFGGAGLRAANVAAGKDIGPITVKGSIDGSDGRVVISAVGAPTPTAMTDVAIAKITVTGDVVRANVLGGFNTAGSGVNVDAQIGAISVGGDWVESVVSAGVLVGMDQKFGTIDDLPIAEASQLPNVFAKIASVKIGGQLVGLPITGPGQQNGAFLAQNIGSFTLGGVAIAMQSGSSNDDILLGQSKVRLREFA